MRDAIEGMNGQELDCRNITVNESQSRGSSDGGFCGPRREGGGGGGGGYGHCEGGGGGGGYGRCAMISIDVFDSEVGFSIMTTENLGDKDLFLNCLASNSMQKIQSYNITASLPLHKSKGALLIKGTSAAFPKINFHDHFRQALSYRGEHHAKSKNVGGIAQVQELITKTGIPSTITSPLASLHMGNWVKLICGASFEDVTDIRNLSLVYTLAGGIEAARCILPIRRPWVMISVNDGEDLHFRKAEFNPDDCPLDCLRPCENVCPADAIFSNSSKADLSKGVLAERCYGCGRCLPICPYDNIRAITYVRDVTATAELLQRDEVDAIEIHTSGRQAESFQELWDGLGDSIHKLRLVAVSLPDLGESTIPAMDSMYTTMKANLHCLNLWQLDGRPMSGDIGRGTTREAIKFALHLASLEDKPKGFLQLAGGANAHTVEGLKKERLFQTTSIFDDSKVPLNDSPETSHALISGVAFGGYARKIVGRVLSSLQSDYGYARLEDHPDHLLKALEESLALVGTVKCYNAT
ncbi:uncharacterized protein LOC131024236 isoform X2 [Salvia miltiorrhiza]|uniref:uncharacterized protein LOC131024236 isoform X2 n=1 Tax=Salvia miltiorrhiza TaxID=226208 RepID=UPI0025AC3711|nr:uncharacterized protein LOC131024236 isoform X2 [Salvia miltiorrhiza]